VGIEFAVNDMSVTTKEIYHCIKKKKKQTQLIMLITIPIMPRAPSMETLTTCLVTSPLAGIGDEVALPEGELFEGPDVAAPVVPPVKGTTEVEVAAELDIVVLVVFGVWTRK
jgi:hypothetical protein